MTAIIVLAFLLSVYIVVGTFALRISSNWSAVREAEAFNVKIDALIDVPGSQGDRDFSRYFVMLLLPLRFFFGPWY